MESFNQSHKNLQIFCADFWPSVADCELILGDVGIDSRRISMSDPPIMRWLSIIQEMRRRDDGSMARLVVVLMKQYPENKQLREVCAPWIPVAPAKEPTASAESVTVPNGAVLVKKFDNGPKKVVPLVVAEEFADEADLVIPRIDTLWVAMGDTEKRMAEMERLWADLHDLVVTMLGKQPEKAKAK